MVETIKVSKRNHVRNSKGLDPTKLGMEPVLSISLYRVMKATSQQRSLQERVNT